MSSCNIISSGGVVLGEFFGVFSSFLFYVESSSVGVSRKAFVFSRRGFDSFGVVRPCDFL